MAMRRTICRANITIQNMSPKALKAEYAVRGPIVIRSLEIKKELEKGVKKDFKRIISCNIGNPQELLQKPFTFHRQVLSLFACPQVLDNPDLHKIYAKDAIERAKFYMKKIGHWHMSGAYTVSKGYAFARDSVAKYIEERDNANSGKQLGPVDPEKILLGNGASASITFLFQLLVGGPSDGILIPVPQYPLYSALLALQDGTPLPYYLDETKGWSLTMKDLNNCLAEAKAKKATPRAMVIINPGNPTGQVFSHDTLKDIIQFCYDNEIALLADEVYQSNVYVEDKKFVSARQVLKEMPEPVRSKVQLISFHSVSKGLIGECGRRGGYMQLENLPEEIELQVLKLASIGLCSNVDGQIMTELMLNPPKPGEDSFEQYEKEKTAIYDSLKRRATWIAKTLASIPGVTCNEVEGSMYAFPRLHLPKKFIDYAVSKGRKPEAADAQWCFDLMEQTGVVTVPGSGFGQLAGTQHFRTTILPPEGEIKDVCGAFEKFQKGVMEKYS